MDWTESANFAYWVVLTGGFLSVAVWESWRPKRKLEWPTGRRWGVHAVLFGLTAVLIPVVLRATPVAAAVALEAGGHEGWAVLRNLPWPAALIATFLLFDLAQYWIHRCFHAVPALWRVHEIHHSDPDFDVGTAIRFHPVENFVITGCELVLIWVLAPPAWAFLSWQLTASFVNLLAHANAALPETVERVIRKLVVTPDLHRIHHSADPADYSRNYGQSLTVWDRIFGTLLREPAMGQERMMTGVPDWQGIRTVQLVRLLVRPLQSRGATEDATLNPQHRSTSV